jgi:hypothetical protein
MKCYKCGQTIEDTATFCRFCGASQKAGAAVQDDFANPTATPVYDAPVVPRPEPVAEPQPQQDTYSWQNYQPAQHAAPAYQPAAAPAYQPNVIPSYQPQPKPYQMPVSDARAERRPVAQFPTNRGLFKMIFLGLITFGIYNIVVMDKIVTELNIAASRYDGRRTMPYFSMTMLSPITLFIYPLVWIHGLCDRIGCELNRRGIDYKFGASTFWLWNVLGSLILVGPWVYTHKMMKAMNKINEDFNMNG